MPGQDQALAAAMPDMNRLVFGRKSGDKRFTNLPDMPVQRDGAFGGHHGQTAVQLADNIDARGDAVEHQAQLQPVKGALSALADGPTARMRTNPPSSARLLATR